MNRKRVAVVSALAAVGALAMTACNTDATGTSASAAGAKSPAAASASTTTDLKSLSFLSGTAKQHNAPSNTGDFYKGSRTSQQARKWVELSRSSANGLKPIVVDGSGFTLYRFDNDTTHPSASNCTGTCLQKWPAVEVDKNSKIFLRGVPAKEIGVILRPDDHHLQLTINGSPIYRFSGDTAPGQTNGENVGGTWFAVSPTGDRVKPKGGFPSTAPTNTPSPSASTPPAGGEPALGSGMTILDSGKNLQEPNGSAAVSGTGCQEVAPAFPAQSVELAGGPAKLWDGPNCTGHSLLITSDVKDLPAAGFNGPVASVRFGN